MYKRQVRRAFKHRANHWYNESDSTEDDERTASAFRIGHRAGTAVLPPCSTPQQLTEHQSKNTRRGTAGAFILVELTGVEPVSEKKMCIRDSVKAGDIMVGGENFGCGSSREHAPVAIKAAGIDCVIAKSFARIFYRNAINIGLPILECPAASEAINEGDVVAINFDTGVITDETTGQTFQAAPFPPFIQKIIKAGGLMKSIQEGK